MWDFVYKFFRFPFGIDTTQREPSTKWSSTLNQQFDLELILEHIEATGDFQRLPVEILTHICEFLNYVPLCALGRTCKALYWISCDDRLWRYLYNKCPKISKRVVKYDDQDAPDWKVQKFEEEIDLLSIRQDPIGDSVATL
jgi:hypothetical protein